MLWQVAVGLAVLTPLPAAAGPSCMSRPVDACALVNTNAEIFVGRVLGNQSALKWRMQVVRSFRGTARGVVTIDIWSSLDVARLEPGQDYLFYVSRSVENGTVTRSTPQGCGGWMRLADVSQAELDLLSRLDGPTTDGRIVGDVVRSVDFRTREPLAGVPVSLSTGATVVSDAAGRFEFRGLAPGSYLLRAELPDELLALASANPIELQPHACAGVSVRAVPNTTVRGRVILPQSFRAEGLMVSLLTPDGVLVENAYADSQGTFVIAGQPPGEYIVGVNTSGMPPTPDNPFPPTFAPGTTDIQKADRIRLEVPTDLTDVNIIVPRASPVATITVAARDVLGRPVEAAQLVTSSGGGDVRLGQTDARGVARVRLVGGVRQYLMVSGLGGCASPVAMGPADLPATLEVTLHREGCREAHELRRAPP